MEDCDSDEAAAIKAAQAKARDRRAPDEQGAESRKRPGLDLLQGVEIVFDVDGEAYAVALQEQPSDASALPRQCCCGLRNSLHLAHDLVMPRLANGGQRLG